MRLSGNKAGCIFPDLATDTIHSSREHMDSCKICELEQVICAIDRSLWSVYEDMDNSVMSGIRHHCIQNLRGADVQLLY